MPEHVHLLIHPRAEKYSISRILSTLKQPVSKRAILYVQRHARAFLRRITGVQPSDKAALRFWQRGGGYDRNLWSPEHIWETIDYIHANPVRRDLCCVGTDWHWSSARAYAGQVSKRTNQQWGEEKSITIDFDSLPDDPRRINAAH
jgi:putative transposase